MKPRLLVIADQVCHTGFARVAHALLEHLRHSWDVVALGINHWGDPHPYPYPIYPASLGGDVWGLNRFRKLADPLAPDLIFIIQDTWIVSRFLALKKPEERMVAYMPVDGKNQSAAPALNALDLAIFYTQFGATEARASGYTGPSAILPHGVDLRYFHPIKQDEARQICGLDTIGVSADAYCVGAVNRNQPRKRLDLTIQYVAEWIQSSHLDNVYLQFHCAPKDVGWDLRQLAAYYGLEKRVIFTADNITSFAGVKESDLKFVYSSFDVQLSTTQGEGWGLTQMEGMACGIPQIVPHWSALAEWPKGAVVSVPCTTTIATPNRINTIGGIMDKTACIEALHRLYTQPELRAEYGRLGRARVEEPQFRWEEIAKRLHELLLGVLEQPKGYPEVGEEIKA